MNTLQQHLDDFSDLRLLSKTQLVVETQQARAATLKLLNAFVRNFPKDTAWRERFPWINPPLWEFGHIAWFQEYWLLRRTSEIPNDQDELYNSAEVSRETRWTMDALEANEVQRYLSNILDRSLIQLEQADPNDHESFYFFRLTLAHELMHIESLLWMAQSLGFDPEITDAKSPLYSKLSSMPSTLGSIRIPTQTVSVAATPGFHFDNEAPGHSWVIEAFEVDASMVSHGQYAAFVDAGGYHHDQFWCPEGLAWRQAQQAIQPAFWRVSGLGIERQWFGRWEAVLPSAPMLHLSLYEAQAYCRWAKRQLPSEAQWLAGTQAGMDWGAAWEWLSESHQPFPGFKPHAYREYSEPWFGNHQLLKGGSLLADRLMHHPHYRNFFKPSRLDVTTGFRTVHPL